ncbi:hypothetical protein M378DRAFT_24485 [Amanita muscaria Koide BX008]|uniref:Elongation factor 1-gamma n=1 Tax=Amanita muscaria (strain Koide BX008) TaxID=946122 RepID=A0A0C2SN25_AMAMK|nr:hypothetical protein M378DRAFT_24485 [Amanita muscaria Koide BX008]
MAPIGTLWTVPQQSTGTIIRATAAYGGLELASPESYEHYVDNKKPEFLAKFPHGKIPSFEGADGFKLSEGIPIALYIASQAPNSGLYGPDPKDIALINQWIHLAESEFDSSTITIFLLLRHMIPYIKPLHTLSLERAQRALNTFDAHLKTRTFLVGDRITLADIVLAGYIKQGLKFSLDAEFRAKIPNVIRHFETIVNQPKLKDVFGTYEYVEKIQYTPPPKEKKEAKPQPAPTPKAEKKPKKEEKDEEEEEELVPAEPKAKNPLDDLPKSTLNLEEWKRVYSNRDTRGAGGALEWFYQNHDPAGFSVWRVDFKYNEELTLTFMSSNQIGGFFNRLEASRKYLFGSVGVLGEANNSVISGALILRGLEVEPVINAAPDWESYSYSKLDLSNESDKAFFEAALAWDLEVDGKKWVDGKNFK